MPSGDVKKAQARPPVDRVLDRVLVDEESGCWVWTGSWNGPAKTPYGTVITGSHTDGSRRLRSTHRVVYEALEGPIPSGLVLDHLCRNTLCCNPGHLEPVTIQENTKRMVLSDEERQRRSEWMKSVNARRWS